MLILNDINFFMLKWMGMGVVDKIGIEYVY